MNNPIFMKPILLLIILACPLTTLAQTEQDIRKHYTEVNKQIESSVENGYEGPLFNNEWTHNKNGKSWPAVGLFSEKMNFWYEDDPNHLPAAERHPKNVLVKVNIVRTSSHLNTFEEYLYKDGRLLFFYSQLGEEGNAWATRVYFNNKGVAFKSSVKLNDKELNAKDFLAEEYRDLKPNPAAIMNNAKKYQDLFVKSMQ